MKYLVLISIAFFTSCSNINEKLIEVDIDEYRLLVKNVENLKNEISPDLNSTMFLRFMIGYSNCLDKNIIKNNNIVTLVDYSRPSNKKRLYVIDIKNQKILYNTLVAHGRNSEKKRAKKFSNSVGSRQSCLGFLLTRNTYQGKYGYSLKLDGCEKGINDNAAKRFIVMHKSDYYVSENFVREHGRLGRSYGCLSLPQNLNDEIIRTIKNGTLIFAFHKKQGKDLLSEYRVVNNKTINAFDDFCKINNILN